MSKITKQQLGAKIWHGVNRLRKNLEAYEYKDYILGLLLYKFLCQKQTEYLISQDFDKDDLYLLDDQLDRSTIDLGNTGVINWGAVDRKIESLKEKNGFFIQHRNLFDSWVKNKQKFDIKAFQGAFKDFSDGVNEIVNKSKKSSHASLFKGLFSKFETDLAKLAPNAREQTEVISQLIDTINEIPTTRQQYDVLGFIYEYLIAQFASTAGKKAGEFYTPHEVSDLISRIVAFYLQKREKISIYDPTSGSGGLLLNIGQEFKKYSESAITYYAQEIKNETYNLTRMNLIMSNINSNQIHVRRGDTLEDDWPLFENEDTSTYRLLTVDAVVSNPPYSQRWEPKNAGHTERFDEYGLPPENKADYAFLLHDLYHIKKDGIGAVILPHGVLFRGGSEGQIRKKLVEKGQIDAIIGLPANMFYGTGIETVIIILKKLRDERDILFVDASNLFVKDGKNNRFAKSHIKKIADIVNNRLETEISKIISFEEIEKNNFNLNISRYVELTGKKEEEHDLFSLVFGSISKKELKHFDSFFLNFPKINEKMFKENQENSDYYNLLSQDYINIIYNDSDFQNYLESFETKVRDFINFFKSKVSDINSIKNINLIELEKDITEYIFSSLKFPLIDTYDVYQIIIDNFENVKEDLELLRENFSDSDSLDIKEFLNDQIESVGSINQKEKDFRRIKSLKSKFFSNDLIEQKFFPDEFAQLNKIQDQIDQIESEVKELYQIISDEDKTNEIYNDEKNTWIQSGIKKLAKTFKDSKESREKDSFESLIIQINEKYSDIEKLKKDLANLKNDLANNSYNQYLNLNEKDFYDLLISKWWEKFIQNFKEKSEEFVDEQISGISGILNKYKHTFVDIQKKVSDLETKMSTFLDELEGNPADMEAIKKLSNILKAN
ncbi:type I restriction-modification system subunit M [Mesomycoplasma ovipneumoniae]|uniref:site-specific DNA-methyltransferase (adenine-specific) n=1 Tax=Mesomycoplasma ovipneumoniae TaxID=29562 RepID=A0AAJ2P8T6_9BACT|nr:type I restriction-modification system subunit M [Mesomycoplasma ovipneumoniae]MDW2829776.1 type I restriction-modification system subunit M [Mesomycoplasma ovipneumoniae]MDW2835825.1 type I restriction-modification system subunit M [Mesomycoplasma ovipneumoniae]MDW2861968.1 type I restriction-modification system subunit M [Mesomycoplasma ovipneumoniae]MDW2871229.1 type I restriction-modification system subunit M [Mesomycoplasma ovipneumoniae]MDW2891474.1 type I restriction-modification sys